MTVYLGLNVLNRMMLCFHCILINTGDKYIVCLWSASISLSTYVGTSVSTNKTQHIYNVDLDNYLQHLYFKVHFEGIL